MKAMSDRALSGVSGQYGGMSLSGDVSFNRNGGPLQGESVGFDCTEGGRCGSRIAVQLNENGGWFVLDDLQGTFEFKGLTLATRLIDGGDSGFGADATDFSRPVIEVGLPEMARFEDFSYTMATSATARPSDTGFQQTERLTVEMGGEMTLDGNALIFPTGP
ncbi:MAG: hypothetical protein GWN58_28135 [Anaerolineae bacterium]|nr:hypothetical protein [Anaerolineae bacterium]